MKPIYVKMSAFGSYAGEVTVDFTAMDHGIFLITGDTGAGKTTIFDAITYALYDKTSGGKRDGEMMRSQFADEDVRTFVEFKFMYKGASYIITRYPRQERISKKRNKDGEYTRTIDQASVELIMPDGIPYRGKIKEINQKIEDIIGLDVNQFTQIAMIAQGDFLKLLHAPSKERKEIFARIFDTEIYRRIEDELRDLAKAVNGKLEDNRKDIIREMDNIQCIEGSAFANEWEQAYGFSESNQEVQLFLVRQIIDEAKQTEKELNEKLSENQDKLNMVITEIKQADEINKLFDALLQLQNKKEELDAKKEEMELINHNINTAKKAAVVVPKEQALLSRQQELTKCRQRICAIKEWLEKNKELLQSRKKESELKEAEYKSKNPILATTISKINELLPKFEKLEELSDKLELCKKEEQAAMTGYEQVTENIRRANQIHEQLIKEQAELRIEADKLLTLSQAVDKLKEKKASLDNLMASMQTLKKYRNEYELKIKEFQEAEASANRLTENYETLYQNFIEGQAAILAHELKEGCPCPVCGSTTHPTPAALSGKSISQAELQKAKNDKDNAQRELEKKKDAMQQAKQQYEKQKTIADIEGSRSISPEFNAEAISAEELKVALFECSKQLEDETEKKKRAEAAKKAFDTNELKLKQLGDSLENYRIQKEAASQALKEAEIKAAELTADIKNLQASLVYNSREAAQKELAATNEQMQQLELAMTSSAKSYQQLLEEANKQEGNLKAEEATAVRMTDELLLLEQDFNRELISQGFIDKTSYHAAIIPAAELAGMEKRYQLYREELIRIENSLNHYTEQTKGKARIQTDALTEKKAGLEAIKRQLEDKSKTVFGIRSRNEAILIRVEELTDIRQKLKKEFSIINRLEATATGKAGPKRLNFQTYIQRRYFNSILNEANKRLIVMSNGQFILKCRDIEDLSNQGEVGLDLDVYSLVNDQSRDVKTLSGGESFMAALAMALGMGDIIQNTAGSIHIDTMFIDEGFGSLSDETRRQAINILQGLSDGKRLVGIISHVSELKAQIGTKLIVTKTDKGSRVKWELME